MKKVNQKGFSIIEVLIVLAIAGLIMLVVFLAVPALQRNARNNGRSSDAQKFAAAVNQCLSNNNGKINNCVAINSTTGVSWTPDSDAGQLTAPPLTVTGVTTAAPKPTAANLTTALTSTTSGLAATANQSSLVWAFGYRCNGADVTDSGTSTREFVVVYRTEGSGGTSQACISS